MSEAFVPASRLYNVESRTPIAHPATQATDEQVRRALEQREVRADGGRDPSSSDTERRTTRDERIEERPPFVDATAEITECYFCGQTWEPTVVDGFDLSPEDEYYPKMVPVCPEHAGGCR